MYRKLTLYLRNFMTSISFSFYLLPKKCNISKTLDVLIKSMSGNWDNYQVIEGKF